MEHLRIRISQSKLIFFKIPVLIFSSVVIFQIILYFLEDNEFSNDLVTIVSILCKFAVFLMSFLVSRWYGFSTIFGKGFFALSMAYFVCIFGEILWFIHEDALNISTHSSYLDIFFFSFYPIAMIQLILIMKNFSEKFDLKDILKISSIATMPISVYFYLSLKNTEEINSDFLYGLVFVIPSSILLASVLFTTNIFRKGIVGISWILFSIGIFLSTVGNVWYYNLKFFDEYTDTHLVNLFWYSSNWFVVYSLIKHKQII